MKIFFSQKAEEDIIDIATYIAKDNAEISNKVFDKVWYTCNLIANMPKIGTPVNSLIDNGGVGEQVQELKNAMSLLADMRRFPVSGYSRLIIFYTTDEKQLKIVRILHGSRDIPALFMTMFTDMD